MSDRVQALIEGLAELEHDQWWQWAKNLVPELNDILYKLPEGSLEADRLAARLARWSALFKPYAELTEEQKEQDREWARKSVSFLASQGLGWEEAEDKSQGFTSVKFVPLEIKGERRENVRRK